MYPLLIGLGFVLPFEWTRPLFTVGGLEITGVELVLYASVVTAAIGREALAPSRFRAIHWAALSWAAANVLSAAFAVGERTGPMRFALRMAGGALLVFPACEGARSAPRGLRVLQALSAGAVLSAALGVAEAVLPGAASQLSPFKTVTAHVGDALRASGPFQYPNPAALYWAAALPAVLIIGPSTDPRASARRAVLTALSTLVLITAICASGSRGGFLTAAAVLGVLLVVLRGPRRTNAASALAGLILVGLIAGLARPELVRRGGSIDDTWFASSTTLVGPLPRLAAGQSTELRLVVRNVGTKVWPSSGPGGFGIGARWRVGDGRIDHDEPAQPLRTDVLPGSEAKVAVEVTAPNAPGSYHLSFELVSDGATFDGAAGSPPVPITVAERPGDAAARSWPPPRPAQRQVTRLELWRAGLLLWRERPLLGVGPDNFRRLYGRELGPRALDDRVNANSLYVETLADLGLLGVVALGAVFLTLGLAGARALRHLEDLRGSLGLASGTALLAFAIHGSVDHVLPFTSLYGLFWLHAGLLAGQAPGGMPPRPTVPDRAP